MTAALKCGSELTNSKSWNRGNPEEDWQPEQNKMNLEAHRANLSSPPKRTSEARGAELLRFIKAKLKLAQARPDVPKPAAPVECGQRPVRRGSSDLDSCDDASPQAGFYGRVGRVDVSLRSPHQYFSGRSINPSALVHGCDPLGCPSYAPPMLRGCYRASHSDDGPHGDPHSMKDATVRSSRESSRSQAVTSGLACSVSHAPSPSVQ